MDYPVSEPYNVRALAMNGGKQNDEQPARSQYSMPGILHFLQTEWARYETDRTQWEVDRAELQAKVAFLQGERKAQENLKRDLVRRIKMLEYALRQERNKFHRLKYGSDLEPADLIPPNFNEDAKDQQIVPGSEGHISNNNNNNNRNHYKQGHQLLRQYLQEIGYTDAIIEVRSARIRQMLGLPLQENNENTPPSALTNGIDIIGGKRPIEAQGSRLNVKKALQSIVDSAANLNTEESVMSNFDFLACENGDETFADNDLDNGQGDCKNDTRHVTNQNLKMPDADDLAADTDEIADADTEDALAEFDFLENDRLGRNNTDANKNGSISLHDEWNSDQQMISKISDQFKKEGNKVSTSQTRVTDRPSRAALKAMLVNLDSDMDAPALQSGLHSPPRRGESGTADSSGQHKGGIMGILGDDGGIDGLGELADLSVNNEGESPISDVLEGTDFHRKAWAAKYTLRSHFDAIRAVVFHPVEPAILTGGEDHVVKLWNLQKASPGKKVSCMDLEPVCTFRAHTGPVTCLVVSATGEMCYSGSTDGTICCWNLPNMNTETYDSYDPSVLHARLTVHTNAVWGLSLHNAKMQLLSCSADGTVRLWNPESKTPLLNTFRVESESGAPTSVDFVRCEPNQMVVSYSSSNAYVFDMEKSAPIVTLECPSEDGVGQINRIITHPTLPVTIVAHDDRHIRFFDNSTGKVVHSMVAHLDSITSLALDPSGLYLLSGSHDCSMRLWNLESKTCIQEITAHRKKFDESIHDVAFHPSKPYIASVGADGVAKVFV